MGRSYSVRVYLTCISRIPQRGKERPRTIGRVRKGGLQGSEAGCWSEVDAGQASFGSRQCVTPGADLQRRVRALTPERRIIAALGWAIISSYLRCALITVVVRLTRTGLD